MNLLAAEIAARTGKDPAGHYQALTAEFGTAYLLHAHRRAGDAGAEVETRKTITRGPQVAESGGRAPIIAKLTRAPGNGEPIGGLKVVSLIGWFAAHLSGTEPVYKIYAESF